MAEAYNPLTRFESEFKDSFAKNASDCFEKLAIESGIDPAENARLVGEYNVYTQKFEAADSRHTAYGWGIFFMVVALIGSVAAGIWAFLGEKADFEAKGIDPAILAIICLLIAFGSILAMALWLVPARKRAKELRDACKAKADEFRQQAEEQMLALNKLYTWDIAVRIIEKTMPDVIFDTFSNEARMLQFNQEFGWDGIFGNDASVLFTQTGELAGNPFAFCKLLCMNWGTETYTGSITIHWTTVERDSKGRRYTQHHTQTLTASVTKPKPEYVESTIFVFANEAAPNLSFTRACSGLAQKADSFLGRLSIKRTRSELEAFSRNLEDESNYTMMANKDFETFFNTKDRDHEVEFRVLFTPMAQKSIIDLLKDTKSGYGDDFDFNKDHKINIIRARHLNEIDLDTRPERFYNFSLEEARKNFVSWTCEYFRSIYFSMAPVLSIPIYMQTLPQSKLDVYPELALKSANAWECEATANYIGESYFAHPSSVTRNILKVGKTTESADMRSVDVTAYGYRTVKHTEIVSVFGGDGRFHDVPVKWLEYLPVSQNRQFNISEATRAMQDSASSIRDKADFMRRKIFVFR